MSANFSLSNIGPKPNNADVYSTIIEPNGDIKDTSKDDRIYRIDAKVVTKEEYDALSKPNEGAKFDSNKPDFSLIPPAALFEEAILWTDGQAKYAAFNWHKGIKYRRILSAIGRHYALMVGGIDMDYETKRHHAAAIRCGCAMLLQFKLEGRDAELDDRIKLTDEAKKRLNQMAQGESIFDILKETT
jgi:hypothetical protein